MSTGCGGSTWPGPRGSWKRSVRPTGTRKAGFGSLFFPAVCRRMPDLPTPVAEDAPLGAHTLPYAIHKQESEMVVQQRAGSLRGAAFHLRPHILAGATVENYLMGAFRERPMAKGRAPRDGGNRDGGYPAFAVWTEVSGQQDFSSSTGRHARLIAWILNREPEARRVTILNVAGRGEALSFEQCIALANARLLRVPGKWTMRRILQLLWNWNISAIRRTPSLT